MLLEIGNKKGYPYYSLVKVETFIITGDEYIPYNEAGNWKLLQA